MPKWKNRFYRFNHSHVQVIGSIFILLLALVLLWRGNATSNQAVPAMKYRSVSHCGWSVARDCRRETYSVNKR